jgi:predicted dehydrogenase/nucleoside-diphosphate-sugar epimerase
LTTTPIRLGIIGCGAVTHLCHLPALRQVPELAVTAVMDADVDRAGSTADTVASELGTRPATVDSIEAFLPSVDAALVCTSNTSHAALAVQLLAAGKHVLIEKPLATSTDDVKSVMEAGRRSGAIAAVGHVRRVFPLAVWVRQLIREGTLGDIRRLRWHEGDHFSWPAASPGMFRADLAGGGVILDIGVHVFDLLLHWLGPDAELIRYSDDSAGGIESEASVRLRIGDTIADIELSRRRALGNFCEISGTSGTLRVDIGVPGTFEMLSADGQVVEKGTVPVLPPAEAGLSELYVGQLRIFADAIRDGAAPLVGLEEAARTVQIAEAGYRSAGRGTTRHEWERVSDLTDRLAGSRVAVTGASGFLGARLVETLVGGAGANVLALTRSLNHQPRLSRLPNQLFDAAYVDLLDPQRLEMLLTGVDTVVHCAYGSSGTLEEQWRTTVVGTANVIQACRAAGVKRLVYVSSISVYQPEPHVTERTGYIPVKSDDLLYDQQKLLAENAVLQAVDAGLDAVVVQPTTIYGPFGPLWTTAPLKRLASTPDLLPAAGQGQDGICNAVFVDDVVQALVKASVVPGAAGQRVIVSGPEPITWGRLFDGYRAMLGVPASSTGMHELPGWERRLYTLQSRVQSELAHEVLGYRPQYELAAGMAAVEKWARWYGLLDGGPEVASARW